MASDLQLVELNSKLIKLEAFAIRERKYANRWRRWALPLAVGGFWIGCVFVVVVQAICR